MPFFFSLDALAYPPPSVTSWEKPITHSAHLHSPVATSNTPSTSISNTILSSCSSVISTDDQVIASTSDHSDQHDSDICVSDHPASASSSERSSPSNDYKIITPMITENSNEVSDLVSIIESTFDNSICVFSCVVFLPRKLPLFSLFLLFFFSIFLFICVIYLVLAYTICR